MNRNRARPLYTGFRTPPYTAAHLVNQHVAERVRGERDRRRFVRAWAAGDQPRDVPASAAAILTRHAGTTAVFNDFHHSLMELTKQTPYPQAELERIRARAGQHEGLTTGIA